MTQTISVIGAGWSFKEVDHKKVPGFVIACNDAGLKLRRPVQEIVSMDRLWTEHRWQDLQALAIRSWLRRSAVQNIDWMGEDWVHIFDCDHTSVEFSRSPERLNGTNTGTCAINLAYIFCLNTVGRMEVFLFGFDMCRGPNGSPYWYDPYPWAAKNGGTSNGKYLGWAAEFEQIALTLAAQRINVVNVSEHSKITAFPKISPKELGIAA